MGGACASPAFFFLNNNNNHEPKPPDVAKSPTEMPQMDVERRKKTGMMYSFLPQAWKWVFPKMVGFPPQIIQFNRDFHGFPL